MDYQIKNADLIDSLPTNQVELQPSDIQIVNTIFKPSPSTLSDISKILHEFRDAFIYSLIIVLFSTDKVDELLKKFIPFTETSYIGMLVVKVLLATILIWALKTWLRTV